MVDTNVEDEPSNISGGSWLADFAGLVAALPDAALAFGFLINWLDPTALGAQMVQYFLLVMLLEFIIMHSAAIMGVALFSETPVLKKLRTVLGLAMLYSIFVAGFALSFKTWWPLGAFWGLSINRLAGSLVGQAPTGKEQDLIKMGWAWSAVLYLGFTFATLLLPVPRLGLTDEAVRLQNLSGDGIWVDEPHRVLAFGFLYFTGQTYFGLTAETWLQKSLEAKRRTP